MSAVMLTAGETMALLDPDHHGPPRCGARFTLRVAGAEEAEGVDLCWTVSEAQAPTGLFLKVRSGGRSSVVYYRSGSAASRLEAEPPLHGLIDWYLCGSAEASLLFGADDDHDLLDAMSAAGIDRAVVRAGRRGSLVMTGDGVAEVSRPDAGEADVLDEIGAGDAFAAGFAFGLLRGWPAERCTRAGHTIAAYALRGTGDWETLPRLDEVAEALEGAPGRGAC